MNRSWQRMFIFIYLLSIYTIVSSWLPPFACNLSDFATKCLNINNCGFPLSYICSWIIQVCKFVQSISPFTGSWLLPLESRAKYWYLRNDNHTFRCIKSIRWLALKDIIPTMLRCYLRSTICNLNLNWSISHVKCSFGAKFAYSVNEKFIRILKTLLKGAQIKVSLQWSLQMFIRVQLILLNAIHLGIDSTWPEKNNIRWESILKKKMLSKSKDSLDKKIFRIFFVMQQDQLIELRNSPQQCL